MRTTLIVVATVAATLAVPAAANAHDRADCSNHLERAYSAKYREVRKRHGTRAPGRDIRSYGVVRKNQTIRPARCGELRRSLQQLQQLLTVPRPYQTTATATVAAVPPAQMPSGVESPTVTSSGGSSNPMVNPACESGGNPQVVDQSGTYWGKYQFDRSTWVASGGSAGSYGSASEVEQDRVAANVTYDAWPNC